MLGDAPKQSGLQVKRLSKEHDRSGFSCGVEALDRYLKEQAGQDAKKGVAAPFVLLDSESSSNILGYYTLSAMSVDIGAWPPEVAKRLPRYPNIPVTLLGRLAVDNRLRGKGAGRHLLVDALHRALAASQEVASVAVVVDAKDENAAAFYRRYGFIPFLDQPQRLFLPMTTIEKVLLTPD